MLRVRGIDAYYDRSHVLHDISLEVGDNQIVALLGRNGAGKSTTIKSIMGVSPPETTGDVEYNGHSLSGKPSDEVFGHRISWVPETRRVFPNLTVADNLTLGSNSDDPNFESIYDLFPRLEERRNQKAGTLSGGEQQMLTIGRALISEPDLLLVDEPFEGLMPQLVTQFAATLRNLRERNLSMLIAEQRVELTLELADFVYIIDSGEIVFSDDPEVVLDDEELQERYLGVRERAE